MIAPDGHGGAFITFQEAFEDMGYVQRIRADCTRGTGWPSVGLHLVDPSISSGTGQQEIAIAPDNNGGAIVVWNDTRNGISNQLYAQRYSGDDITAALTSLVSVEALPDRVTLVWAHGGSAPLEVNIERRDASEIWQSLDRASFDGSGRLEYADRTVAAGTHYAYRLRWIESGVEQLSAETPVDVPNAIALTLDGLRPNPAMGDLNVAFSLPRAGAATIEVIDIGGRVVLRRDVGSLGMGRHVVRMNEGERIHPGVYWLRLTHEGRTLETKGAVLR
jgi:hypothetical protein